MEVIPVHAGVALALAETIVSRTTLAVDRADRRSHRASVGVHGQARALQQRHTGDALFGEHNAARQHPPVAVDDDQPGAVLPTFLCQYRLWEQREQAGEQQAHPKTIALLRSAGL